MIRTLLRTSFLASSGVLLGLAFVVVASQGSLSLAQVAPAVTPTTGAGNMGTTVNQAGNTYNITGGTEAGKRRQSVS